MNHFGHPSSLISFSDLAFSFIQDIFRFYYLQKIEDIKTTDNILAIAISSFSYNLIDCHFALKILRTVDELQLHLDGTIRDLYLFISSHEFNQRNLTLDAD